MRYAAEGQRGYGPIYGEVALGGIAFSADDARGMIARGYRFVVLGSDAGLIAGAAHRMVQLIKES